VVALSHVVNSSLKEAEERAAAAIHEAASHRALLQKRRWDIAHQAAESMRSHFDTHGTLLADA